MYRQDSSQKDGRGRLDSPFGSVILPNHHQLCGKDAQIVTAMAECTFIATRRERKTTPEDFSGRADHDADLTAYPLQLPTSFQPLKTPFLTAQSIRLLLPFSSRISVVPSPL
jgi:hypothetical protein